MSNQQARLLACPIVMVAAALFVGVLREDFPVMMGFCVFVVAGVLFAVEYIRSLRK